MLMSFIRFARDKKKLLSSSVSIQSYGRLELQHTFIHLDFDFNLKFTRPKHRSKITYATWHPDTYIYCAPAHAPIEI